MRIILWNEEDDITAVDSRSFDRVKDAVPIYIYINTGGGNGDEMLACISAIESSKTPIVTYVLGKANSAGFLLAISGHIRIAQRHSVLMYHQAAYGRIGEHQGHVDLRDFDDILSILDILGNVNSK